MPVAPRTCRGKRVSREFLWGAAVGGAGGELRILLLRAGTRGFPTGDCIHLGSSIHRSSWLSTKVTAASRLPGRWQRTHSVVFSMSWSLTTNSSSHLFLLPRAWLQPPCRHVTDPPTVGKHVILFLHLTALEPAVVILWSRCSQTLPTTAAAGSALLSGPPHRAGETPAAPTLPSVIAMALHSFDTPHSDAWTGCTCCGSNISHQVVDSATMASFVLLCFQAGCFRVVSLLHTIGSNKLLKNRGGSSIN